MKTILYRVVAILSVVALSACTLPSVNRSTPTPAIAIDLPISTQAQLRDYDLATAAIADQYIDPKAAGAEWKTSLAPLRDRIIKGVDDTKFMDILDEMLSTLHDDDLSLSRPESPSASATAPVTASFSGIGIVAGLPEINKDRILVLAVYDQSPAALAGVMTHDSVVQIDGKPVLFQDRDKLISQIRGLTGTNIVLTIRTPGKGERDVTLTRQPITPSSTLVARRVPNTNIGYIQPDASNMLTMRLETAQAIRDLSKNQPLDSLVLDLRTVQSPDFPMTEILDLFVYGQVGTLYNRAWKMKLDITGKNVAGSQDLPLVVLVSDQTRGIAESYAGILQDLGRARIVGNQTPGRLSILTPTSLPNSGAAIAIPSGEYRGVKDKSWYKQGIKPDIASELTWEQFTDDNDPQLKQAVQALTR